MGKIKINSYRLDGANCQESWHLHLGSTEEEKKKNKSPKNNNNNLKNEATITEYDNK